VSDSLGCARCGDCCESIWLAAEVVDVLVEAWENPHGSFVATTALADRNYTFLLEHWHLVERASSGAARLSCDAFDAVHRLCTAHDDRPPVCSDFPWYGRPPGAHGGAGSISKRCSYWLDVAPDLRPDGVRPLLPLVMR